MLDDVSIPAFVVLFAIASLVCYEIGFRIGRWWQDREPGEQEGPTGVIVGGLLGLMAFLLAVTMGMASDRFDNRRGLVLEEANTIQAAYLQADYLPQPQRDQLKELLRQYVPLRVANRDRARTQANIQQSHDLQQQMWAIEAQVAESGYLTDLMSALGDTLTALVNVSQTRVAGALYARVPTTVLWLLIGGSVLSLGMLGYSAGLSRRRSLLSAVILIVALGAVTALVIDLDSPQEGFLTVSQQALLDVQESIGSSAP